MGEDELRALGEQLLRVSRRRASSFPGSTLDGSAFRILWLLVEGGPRTLRDLAEQLQLDRSTITRQVNAAIDRGLVERTDPRAGGSRPVRPTEAGREAYRHDAGLWGTALREALDALGPVRAARLVDDLATFNDVLDAVHARTGTTPPG